MLRRSAPDPQLLELFERAGANAERGAALLRDTFAAVPDADAQVREVSHCEHEGDRITHSILSRLAEQGRRTHLDAADVHALAVALDDVVDFAEEAADQLGRYRVEAPMEQAEAIGDLLVAATHEVTVALHELRNGMDLMAHLVEIHRLEDEADQLVRLRRAAVRARDRPDDRDPLEGHLRDARGVSRRLRAGRQRPRGHHAQAALAALRSPASARKDDRRGVAGALYVDLAKL